MTLLGSTLPIHIDDYNRNIFDFQNHKTFYMLMQEAKMIIDEGRFTLEKGEVGQVNYTLNGED